MVSNLYESKYKMQVKSLFLSKNIICQFRNNNYIRLNFFEYDIGKINFLN